MNFHFKIVNAKYVFFAIWFISINCITVKSFINFGGDVEVVLVKEREVKNHKLLFM